MLSNRLAEVNDQLKKCEAENKNLSGHLKHAQNELARSEKVKQEILTKSAEIESSKALSDELERLKASLKGAEDKVRHHEQVESQNSYLLKVIYRCITNSGYQWFMLSKASGISFYSLPMK